MKPVIYAISKYATISTHGCSKFDRYGDRLLPHLALHAKAYFGDFAGRGWVRRGLVVILLGCEVLGRAFDCGPSSARSATRDRLSFHSASLLLRPCLRQDNSPR